MRENYTLARLYIDKSLEDGADISLSKVQTHYLTNVLRLKSGDSIRIFNGQDGEWRAEVVNLSRKLVGLMIAERLRAPSSCPDIWLCFAPVRKHRNAFIIEKATELGASVLQPVITDHTQFPKIRLDKMQAQIIEAAEQTERLDLPILKEPQKLSALIEGWDAERALIMGDEAGDCSPAQTILKSLTGPAALLTGPEGGFSPSERDILRAKDFVTPVSLGPRILRADTAAVSLLTLWQAAQGDWQ